MQQYKVTKFLIGCVINGIVTEITSVPYKFGKYYSHCIGSGGYIIMKIEKVA